MGFEQFLQQGAGKQEEEYSAMDAIRADADLSLMNAQERRPRDNNWTEAGRDTGPSPSIETVYNTVKVVPAAFGAFSSLPREVNPSLGRNVGKVGLALGTAYLAEYAIDKAFDFDKQPIRGGSLLFDFAAPIGIMAAPMSFKYKVPIMVASHVVGKLIDRHG